MNIKYEHANPKKNRNSIIIENNEETFTPISTRPAGGNTSCTRFFSSSTNDKPKFVVKKPVYRYNPTGDELTASIAARTEDFQKEQEAWNSLYPDQKAELITQGEPRLILPCLPGGTIRLNKSEDLLIYCKQVLAVIYALQKFHLLGWAHNDLNQDNVLIDEKADGTFDAYLIDFDRASREYNSNTDVYFINSLIYSIVKLRIKPYYSNLNLLIEDLLTEINSLENVNQQNPVISFVSRW